MASWGRHLSLKNIARDQLNTIPRSAKLQDGNHLWNLTQDLFCVPFEYGYVWNSESRVPHSIIFHPSVYHRPTQMHRKSWAPRAIPGSSRSRSRRWMGCSVKCWESRETKQILGDFSVILVGIWWDVNVIFGWQQGMKQGENINNNDMAVFEDGE